MNRIVRQLAGSVVVAFTATMAYAANPALDLLEQMQASARTLAYEGKLVYQQDTDLTTLRITHSNEAGGEESVVYLDPKTGKDIEDNTSSDDKSFSLSTYSKLQPQTQQAYSFDLGSKEWVANIECQVVIARPKDTMRYLHRYCIDPKTGMLLKYSLMDRNKQVVEQLMFTDVKIADDADTPTPARSRVALAAVALPSETLDAASAAESAPVEVVVPAPMVARAVAAPKDQESKAAEKNANKAKTSAPPEGNAWSFTKLPLGFQKIREIKQSATRTQVIVSDGMTSVSIFADLKSDNEDLDAKEQFSSGAMNILTDEIDEYIITLMGEVPESTLETIRNGLKHNSKP